MMINKSWSKTALWFSYIFNAFFWQSTRFPWGNLSSAMKKINVFYSWYKYKKPFWNIFEEKYFAPLRILNFIIKSFVNPFDDIALFFSDILFNSLLFDVTSFSLLIKSVLFRKLAVSLLIAKFAC